MHRQMTPWSRRQGRRTCPVLTGRAGGLEMRALPEFTAEASIYRSAHQYRSVAASPFRGTAVPLELAQESCLPRFTSCEPDPDSPTGCSRCFQRPDCELICGLQCPCPTPPPPPPPVNCGTHLCFPGQSCCGNGCCTSGTFCCANKGCCRNGHHCRKIFGTHYCTIF